MEKETVGLVFCGDCAYHEDETYDLKARCLAPENLRSVIKWDRLEKYPIQRPWKINKLNSCSWHEPKESTRPRRRTPKSWPIGPP